MNEKEVILPQYYVKDSIKLRIIFEKVLYVIVSVEVNISIYCYSADTRIYV